MYKDKNYRARCTAWLLSTICAHAETEREFCVKADVPGVNKDHLKVYQDGDVLSISAVRPMFICTVQYCRPLVLSTSMCCVKAIKY